jgi:hypothetical protein
MALSMQVSFSQALDDKRTQISIGRVKATTGWGAARGLVADFDREIALRALVREAEEYGADALVEVSFEIEEVRGPDIDVPLRRVTATGTAVRLAVAA